jgi:hypothetical protein
MKIAVHALFAVLVAILLILPGALSAVGAGPRTTPTELSAAFRDAPGDGIQSDIYQKPYISNNDTSGYPNNVQINPNGSLYMRIQQNRRLVFRFGDPIREAGLDSAGRLYCRGYNPTPLKTYNFTYGSLPPFLQSGSSGETANDFTKITTAGVYRKVGSEWTYTTPFDLKSMAVKSPSGVTSPSVEYVGLDISFHSDWQNDEFMVKPEYYLWRGQEPPTGIVKVTRDAANRTWTVETLSAEDPLAWDLATHLAGEFPFNDGTPEKGPLPYPGFSDPGAPLAFQASLVMWVSSQPGKNGHPGGYCDLGDWRLPFFVTLRER